ncbi:efflux RND transporter permease subunit [Bacillus sp. FJAT-49732]|uniref:Efflux RND transporter permease subunit n=1 Tax=Lederbergia citrisecunda TaxID=2833583 RepID=A0A942YM04_9BACI|nr:efflux RND transporter permease subunit [Lederbergia citrisecunda]MBS4201197.1 efflux RND transporter permease subunit [Lederbergia citrisecunda]
MSKWIKFSLRNAGVIFIAMLMVLAGGYYSVKTMKMESMPNVDIPYIIVQVPYVGATPDQALNDVGKPLEASLSGIQKLKNLYIESHSNYVFSILEFDMDKKMDEAEKDVTTAVSTVELPNGAGKPVIIKDGPSAAPVFSFALSSETAHRSELTQFMNNRIKPSLATVDGIGKINIYGEAENQLSVELDSEKMKEKGITYDLVKQSITSHNFSFPAGQVDLNGKTLNVQADYKIASIQDLKDIQLVVPGPTGIQTYKLSDVANIDFNTKKETVYTRINEKQGVLVEVTAQPGSNAVEVVQQMKEKLDSIKLPAEYKITKLYDTSKDVEKSVNTMLREVLLGTLFAVIVTFVFLRNVKATIVAILSIPLSILAAMITMKFFNYSLNMMTLAGIAVAVGRVIDDSIVVIENIYRRTLTSTNRNERMVLSAAKEVGGAVMSSTLTTMAVFGPLSFVPGIIGKFFAPFGITVIVALAFSLIVSLTVVPLLAKLFLLKLKHQEPKENLIQKAYKGALSWALRRRAVTIILAVIVFAGSLALVPMIPKNFLPEEKAASYRLSAELPIGTSLEKADILANDLENVISNQVKVENIQTIVNGENVQLFINLSEDTTTEEGKAFEKNTREALKAFDDQAETALSPIGITGGGGQFVVIVEGGNAKDLEKTGNMIVDVIEDIQGLTNVKTNLSGVKPQLNIEVDDQKAAEKGLNPIMVSAFIKNLIAGENITNIQVDEQTTPLTLSVKTEELLSTKTILDQSITNILGNPVKLSEVASLTEKPGPTGLYRLNQQEYLEVSGRFVTDNVSGVQNEVTKRIDSLKLPDGVKTRSEGQAAAMSEGFTNMTIAMGIAVVLVFIVMLVTFGNMIAPIAILSSLPFLFTGGLLGLYLTKQALGMPALVGFLMLIGIVVTNAIVLMDRVMQNEKSGMDLTASLIEASSTRIRPILMTALATIGALLPLALSSEGGLISRSLAIVVITGLLTSTLLTLVIVPTVYHILKSMKKRFSKKEVVVLEKLESAS